MRVGHPWDSGASLHGGGRAAGTYKGESVAPETAQIPIRLASQIDIHLPNDWTAGEAAQFIVLTEAHWQALNAADLRGVMDAKLREIEAATRHLERMTEAAAAARMAQIDPQRQAEITAAQRGARSSVDGHYHRFGVNPYANWPWHCAHNGCRATWDADGTVHESRTEAELVALYGGAAMIPNGTEAPAATEAPEPAATEAPVTPAWVPGTAGTYDVQQNEAAPRESHPFVAWAGDEPHVHVFDTRGYYALSADEREYSVFECILCPAYRLNETTGERHTWRYGNLERAPVTMDTVDLPEGDQPQMTWRPVTR